MTQISAHDVHYKLELFKYLSQLHTSNFNLRVRFPHYTYIRFMVFSHEHTINSSCFGTKQHYRQPNTGETKIHFLSENHHPERDWNSEHQPLSHMTYQCATVTQFAFTCYATFNFFSGQAAFGQNYFDEGNKI